MSCAEDSPSPRAAAHSPRGTKPSNYSVVPKPIIYCAVFAVGIFIASVTFNLAMYFSLRSKYSVIAAGSSPLLGAPSSRVVTPLGAPAVDIYNNIVMIQVRFATYNRCMPWQTVRATFQPGLELASLASASGLILEHGLILTSAYVATDSYLVTVTRQGSAREYEAEVVGHSRELDLALLNVKDPAFWRDTYIAVKFDEKTEILGRGNKVVVAGFPVGEDLSISKLSSRVSRVEAEAEGYAGRYGSFPHTVLSLYPKIGSDITVGPVFKDGDDRLIGFIGRNDKVIPVRMIAKFMKAYRKDHNSAGLGMLGMLYRPMQSPAMRMYWDLPANDVGVQIRSVAPASELHGVVKKGDVLVAIDGEPILSNGAVSYRKSIDNMGQHNDVALPFSVLLAEKAINSTTKLSFQRATQGDTSYKKEKDFDVTVTLNPLQPLVPRTLDQHDLNPSTYFMLGGLVWTIFTEDLVIQAKHMNGVFIPAATHAAALHRWRENPDEEVVVLLRSLEHPCNKWYSAGMVRVLSHFNGQPVRNMKQFVANVGGALKKQTELLKFTFGALDDDDTAGGPDDPDIVLDTGLCTGADKELMMTHQVKSPASMDLKDVYKTLPDQFTLMPNTHEKVSQPAAHVRLPAKKVTPPGSPQEKVVKAFEEGIQDDRQASGLQGGLSRLPWANIVQVKLTSAEQDFLSPWKVRPSSMSRCSAVVVSKARRMILTNSHCVAGAMSLDVLREDVPTPVKARIIEIARDVDLAWITTDDESFWANEAMVPELSMDNGLPYISHNVRIVGYPQGGSTISISQGIVSRLDGQIYPNGLQSSARNTPDNLLIVQVDAAINPGNSGGPVFDSAGHLVGLAFAVLRGAQNVGYVIPNVHMRNFVASVSSAEQGHRWQAQSEIGAVFHNVENAGMRKFLKMGEKETGVQVRSVSPYSPLAKEGIVKGDVMVAIDGMPVQGNGKVTRDINGKMVTLPFDTVVTEKEHGKSTKVEFMHVDGKSGERTRKAFDAVFAPVAPLVARFDDAPVPIKGREHFAAKPTYFILWGLVWGVFSNPTYLQAISQKKDVPWSVKKSAMHRWRQNKDEEVVVLLQGLGGSTCTLHYDTETMRILQDFNGKRVNSMQDLVNHALEAELNGDDFMRITFEPLADADIAGSSKDPDIVLHRKFCGQADAQVIRANNIPRQFSDDVFQYFQNALKKKGVQLKNYTKLGSTHSLMQSDSQENVREAVESLEQRKLLHDRPLLNQQPRRLRPSLDAMALGSTEGLSGSADEDTLGLVPSRARFVQSSRLDDDAMADASERASTLESLESAESHPLLMAQLVQERGHRHTRTAKIGRLKVHLGN